MESVSEKQAIAIGRIEMILDVKFEGSTKREAWEWMQEYAPKLKQFLFQKAHTRESVRQLSVMGYESSDERILREFRILEENDPDRDTPTLESLKRNLAALNSLL